MTPRSLAYASDVAVLLAGGSTAADEGGALVVRSPGEPTFWWGNFLLLPEVAPDGSASVSAFAAAFPDAAHVAIGFDDPDATGADAAWYAGAGFVIEEMAVLTAPGAVVAGAARTPSHLDCRPLAASSDEDWAGHADLARRCSGDAPGITRRFLDERAAGRRRVVASGAGQWWGAWSGEGELVGQLGIVATGGGLARYQSVETDPAWQRRGIAGELMVRAARAAVGDLGADRLAIVADPAYWAIALYRSLGFVDTERQVQATLPPPTP